MRWLVMLVALALTACSGAAAKPSSTTGASPQPHETAGDALTRQFQEIAAGQWGREWDELHPAQQAEVPRQRYVDCNQATALTIRQLTVTQTYPDAIDEPDIPEKTATAVTFTLTASVNGLPAQTQTATRHEVLVNGAWRWVLDPDTIAAYQAGRCS